MGQILVDTNILSVAYLPNPPDWIWDWLQTMPRGSLAVSWITIYETEYGIRTAQMSNPTKALQLLEWFETFLDARFVSPEMDIVSARVLGAMAATPSLRRFFWTEERRNKDGARLKPFRLNLGCDPMLASMAIAHQLPIATLNPRDFCYIARYFPLPGVYDPSTDIWYVDPPIGWGFSNASNDDEKVGSSWPEPVAG
ncbi:PIN domain-containing protein [Rhizobium leguminosarum]|uniref:type II toxin-antitoxin system VapC family toxin n=1 Tax=Rhizobium leguminosarum TaxID=384 RepID=UPI0010321291|nr:PIN domain-containing protein [Rhizobium leguminosarum]TBF35239.1 PIN domain-containing protein [Rhizobium leguminosarum]